MTNLANICPFVPHWAIDLFSNKYSNEEALDNIGEDGNPTDIDHEYDTLRAGWIRFTDTDFNMRDITLKWDIKSKPTGEFATDYDDRWMFTVDIIGKPMALIYYPQISEINTLPRESLIIFQIDTTGIEECYPKGWVAVLGALASTGEYYTEYIDVDGPGLYISLNAFSAVYQFDGEMGGEEVEGDIRGARATVSVWSKGGTSVGIRECRIWCDANEDGIYGLVFGGYIKDKYGDVNYDDRIACYELTGYAESLQVNEYIAGYRARHRCSFFNPDGLYGSCTSTYGNTNFRKGGSSCYVGDWNTEHPSGVPVQSQLYRCQGYNPSDEILPYDGWTYDPNYAPDTESDYEWYPPTYFRALMAICNMMNSLDQGKAVSRPWGLPLYAERTLSADVGYTDEIIYVKGGTIPEGSEIIVDEEVMHVRTSGSSNAIVVVRGDMNTRPDEHVAGAKVEVPLIAWSTDEETPKLVRTNQLQGPNLRHTVMDTLQSLAENATSEIENAPFVAWVDNFRQIQMTEMDLDRPTISGYDDYFIITINDIIEPPSYCLSEVVNKVSAQVDISDNTWVYYEMTTSSEGMEEYADSVRLFGLCSEEVSNVNLNAIKPTEGKVDFTTFASNYLRVRSFPRLTETIAVNGFIPDEHYWQDVIDFRIDEDDHRYEPYLGYTDPVNKHINLLGTRVKAPDFWLGMDDEGEWIESYFIVEGIWHTCSVEGDRAFITYLKLGRPTLPSEWE